MRILTLAMQVPDSRAAIKVAPDGSGIETAGLKFVCNPFDEFAVEQAVQLKENRSDVEEIVALTIGAADNVGGLRTALAMGADRGIHICGDDLPVHNEVYIAELIAAAIRRDAADFDLILCGKQTIDNDSGELGPALAEHLALPHVGAVAKLEIAEDGASLRANRRVEGAEEIVQAPLPVLITCDKGLVEPRYPSLPNLMKAKKKPMDTVTPADLDMQGESGTRFIELGASPSPPACRMIEGEPEEMARELVRLLHEEAKVV